MANKKGQEMSVATLVLIVIGIVVLVMLILGFSMGWQNLWGKINILGGNSNVETVVQACSIAATSDSSVNYCDEFKQVTIANVKQYINCQYSSVETNLDKKLDCHGNLADASAALYCGKLYGADAATRDATKAAALAKDATLYNGKNCSALLPAAVLKTCAADLNGVLTTGVATACTKGVVSGVASDAINGKVCCNK